MLLLRCDERILLLAMYILNRRRDVISLNQPRGMSAKMAANGIRTSLRQSLNAWWLRLGTEPKRMHWCLLVLWCDT